MGSRREFIQSGVALGALSVPSMGALAATQRPLALHKVVFDGRFGAGQQFGREAARLGANVQDTRGDVTDLWADDLAARWHTAPVAIAGLTTASSLFALQTMAEDPRVRVIYRAHHVALANGRMRHQQFGPKAWLAQRRIDSHDEPVWSRRAAQLVTDWPAALATVQAWRSNIALGHRQSIEHETLVSWVIAPVRRVGGEV